MWLMTRYGFFSAVACKEKTPRAGEITVRARVRQHLINLRRWLPVEHRKVKIVEDTNADYRYRVFLPKAVWADTVKLLVEDIDYGNFKNAATEESGHVYHDALMKVWIDMFALQRPPRRASDFYDTVFPDGL